MTAWWKPTTPDKLPDKPWIGARAVIQFEQLLKPDMRVLEFGSGGSTLWLGKLVRDVVSIETDQKWYEAVSKQAAANTSVILWNDPFPPEFENKFDLLFIDGEPIAWRANWIKAIPQLLKNNGIVVLDNSNRDEYASEYQWLRRKANLIASAKGKGGTYTWTDFFQWHA